MADFMSPVHPPSPHVKSTTAARSNSSASTVSSAGVSLRRRSRIRTRTLTNVGGRAKDSGHKNATVGTEFHSGESSSTSRLQVPQLSKPSPQRDTGNLKTNQAAVQPPLPRSQERVRAWSTACAQDLFTVEHRGRETRSEGGSIKAGKITARGRSLPRSMYRTTMSSDESSQPSPCTPIESLHPPPVRVFVQPSHGNVRESMLSTTSSSLYPRSTSTETGSESSAEPHSLKDLDEEHAYTAPQIMAPVENKPSFDVDDVSFRLRLLVNNNYFLPPAHSKPSPLSLTPTSPANGKKVEKAATPNFLDFFRMGKSKSKPAIPVSQIPTAVDPPGPILRTTSDSTTAAGYVPRPPGPITHSHLPLSQATATRIVVLRERMDDLAIAAKQAEQDIKTRGDTRKANDQSTSKENAFLDDVIDPTDAVDLPLPSGDYPFAVQASVLQGLGVQESVGAAVLANHLPPSPGVWSMSSEEAIWRKAILQEAVNLSFSESSDRSVSSASPGVPPGPLSPDSPSFRVEEIGKSIETAMPATSTPQSLMIGQRIVELSQPEPEDDDFEAPQSPLSQKGPKALPIGKSKGAPSANLNVNQSRLLVNLPRRSETPVAAGHPLSPRPRKQGTSPKFTSQPELAISNAEDVVDLEPSPPSDSHLGVHQVLSPPRLSALHDQARDSYYDEPESQIVDQRIMLSPPPISPKTGTMLSFSTQTVNMASDRHSHYSDDGLSYMAPHDEDEDEAQPRPSMSLTVSADGRPSISGYSHPSPTTSAFQDAVFGSCRSPSPLERRSHYGSAASLHNDVQPGPAPAPKTTPRFSTMSPPPRTSSSMGPAVLPPPPRFSVKPKYRSPRSSSRGSGRRPSTSRSNTSLPVLINPVVSQPLPDPSLYSEPSPPPTIAERRFIQNPLSLHIPTESFPPDIHSAPAPASPTEFFDRIQSHPNAMDDLDTTDESDDDNVVTVSGAVPNLASPVEMRNIEVASKRRPSASSSRPSFMRFGNHSTPQLSSASSFDDDRQSRFEREDRKPVGNIPERGTYFASRTRKKSSKKQLTLPLPLFDPQTLSQERLATGLSRSGSISRSRSPSRRPATAGAAENTRSRLHQRESIQRFDGMLQQHIFTERDMIKQIATNISSSHS